MNEITVSKKHLFLWLLVIILLAAAGFGIYAFRRFLPGHEVVQQAVPTASSNTTDRRKVVRPGSPNRNVPQQSGSWASSSQHPGQCRTALDRLPLWLCDRGSGPGNLSASSPRTKQSLGKKAGQPSKAMRSLFLISFLAFLVSRSVVRPIAAGPGLNPQPDRTIQSRTTGRPGYPRSRNPRST